MDMLPWSIGMVPRSIAAAAPGCAADGEDCSSGADVFAVARLVVAFFTVALFGAPFFGAAALGATDFLAGAGIGMVMPGIW
jgi:hypothetical protein